MSEQTTLNGVKVSYKPKSDKPKVEHKKRSDSDKGKRTYYDNGQSKPARGFGGKNKTFKPRMHERQKAPAPNPFLKLVNNPRFCAVDILYKIEEGQSLSELLTSETGALSDNDKRFAQYLIYGALRQFEILEFQLEHYLQKPIKQSERHVYLALLLAIYEITTMNTAEYAAVNNWVDLIRKMDREWAVGLTNGILRKVLREGLQPLPKNLAKVSLPKWLSSYVINHWGVENACAIADHFLTHPAMIIRVNPLQTNRDEYSALLTEAGIAHEKHAFVESAIVLKDAVSVANLPNFDTGMCSVQDASAQVAAKLLAPQKDEVIVDACAAPGGKTIAMLENNPELDYIFAIDSVESRLNRVQENIDRVFPRELADKIQLIPEFFECFTVDETIDAMLLDVPCSATGIIHRHPDIKRLRQATDIKLLVETQEKLLDHAWAQLKAGGRLLYATCSILKDENEQQMKKFFGRYDDASETELDLPFAQRASYGYQILPVYSELSEKMDGFYYCLIQKAYA